MIRYRNVYGLSVVLACGLIGCDVESPAIETESSPITNAWFSQNFDGLTSGVPLDGNLGWAPVLSEQHSPNVFFVGLDGTYDHKRPAKFATREEGVPPPLQL